MFLTKKNISNVVFRGSLFPGMLLYYLGENHRHGHGIHSPFMYRFIREVLEGPTGKEKFEHIEGYRREMYKDSSPIMETDPGAGSFNPTKQSCIGKKALSSSLNKSSGRLLYRIAMDVKPEICLELGTSVGLGSMYLAMGAPGTEIITIEGNTDLAKAAGTNSKRLGFSNITVINGLFAEHLDKLKAGGSKRMVVWLDGDHRGEALLENLNKILDFAAPGSVIIVDDIRWSSSMHRGWKKIVSDPRIPVSLDLWKMGILFLFSGLQKQHYLVKF
jgi:predicted O-methyltransferase YrrM